MNRFHNIIILGLGLIGGSLALALKRSGYQGMVIGFDTARENLADAVHARAIDIAAQTLEEALLYQGLVVIATPLGAYEHIFRDLVKLAADKNIVVTDVGSVKTHVHCLADQYLPSTIPFIGGHPMSGSEKGGFKAATPYLFENAYYFLTPAERQHSETTAALEKLVQSIGAFPIIVSPQEHDRIVAQISHVPHVLASILANTLDVEGSIGNATFVGGGFRDTTRIASGNPSLWKDILSYNKKQVLQAIQTLETMLSDVKEMVRAEDRVRLFAFLQRAKLIRDGLPRLRKDYLPVIYDIFVDVEDTPGVIGQLTQLVGEHRLNIREIEILHVREHAKGAIRIGFATAEEQAFAMKVLTAHHFAITCI